MPSKPPTNDAASGRIALGLAYDGADFSGWQTQLGGVGVQDSLERALSTFAGEPLTTICAGRTDAGVHATCQVIHVDTRVRRANANWVRGVNRFLPPTVAVRWARPVAGDFHARFAGLARRYDYWIYNDPVRPALAHRRVGWVFRPLDADVMARAAAALRGTHDFSSFRAAECQASSPVRTVTELGVERRGRMIRVRIIANAFLHHMVRNIVGSLVAVGAGRQPMNWVADVLGARDRARAAPTFAASGLYLTGVQYDPRWGLPLGDWGADLGADAIDAALPIDHSPLSAADVPCIEPESRSAD